MVVCQRWYPPLSGGDSGLYKEWQPSICLLAVNIVGDCVPVGGICTIEIGIAGKRFSNYSCNYFWKLPYRGSQLHSK